MEMLSIWVEDNEMLKNPGVVDNQVQAKGTAIRDLRDRYLVEEEQMLGKLFIGYFNNKMAVLVFLAQAQRHRPDSKVISGMCFFLADLYHHMLADSKQKRYRRVFLWLKRFLQKLPNVRLDQRERAVRFIQELYDVFGFFDERLLE